MRGKVQHAGHRLWVQCMAGDPAAWKKMETYNKQDVILLDGLYRRLQPWIPGHPSWASFLEEDVCPKCGSPKLQKRGFAYTQQSVFQRYQCQGCGGWSRGTKRETGVTIREVANGLHCRGALGAAKRIPCQPDTQGSPEGPPAFPRGPRRRLRASHVGEDSPCPGQVHPPARAGEVRRHLGRAAA